MKRFIASLFIVALLLTGLTSTSEAQVYKYKYSYVLVANTDGQTPVASYEWVTGWTSNGDWKKRPIINSPMEISESEDVNIIIDSATGACDSTDWDLNFTHSIDGVLYTTTTHYWQINDQTKDIIKSVQGGLTPPIGFILPTIDEDAGLTCTLDVYFAIDRP